jgi:hypothetical protein
MKVGRLLSWRFRLAFASHRGRGGSRRITLLFLGTGVGVSFFFGAWAWFHTALQSDFSPLVPLAVAGAVHATFLFSLLRDTGAALGYLFVSPEMPLLLATPARPRSLLFWKGLEAVGDALAFPATLVLPILFGFGAASGAPPLYYVAAVLGLLLLLSFTVSLGFLIALVVAPLVPVGRVRQWIRGASGVVYLIIWIGLGWLSAGNGRAVSRVFEQGKLPTTWSGHPPAWPSTWVGQVLMDLARGGATTEPIVYLGITALTLLGASWFAARLYPRAWQRAQELNRKARRYARW